MSREIDAAIAAKLRNFPAFSPSAAHVMQLLRDPNCYIGLIEEALRADPGLTVNLLRIANSPYFGCPGTLASVRDAIMRLGTKRVFGLVVATSVNAVLHDPVPGYDSKSGELWLHSIAVSVAAEQIAEALDYSEKEKEELFTAALLHDIGKVALGEIVRRNSDELQAVVAKGAAFDEAEREILGIDHGEVGALILEQWLLPSSLVDAARWHHHPEALDPPNRVVDLVHAADLLAMSLGFEEGREGIHYAVSPPTLDRLGLDDDAIDHIALQTVLRVKELSTVLLGTPCKG